MAGIVLTLIDFVFEDADVIVADVSGKPVPLASPLPRRIYAFKHRIK